VNDVIPPSDMALPRPPSLQASAARAAAAFEKLVDALVDALEEERSK
jgi:hypothetical protein